MALKPDALRALLSSSTGVEPTRPKRIPLPSAVEAGYVQPNPDQSRKRCGNCYKFLSASGCVEVVGAVQPSMVCILHVFGRPQEVAPPFGPRPKMAAVDVGLVETPGGEGVSCDLCRHFAQDPQQSDVGLCEAVSDPLGMPPAAVEALACCNRWDR